MPPVRGQGSSQELKIWLSTMAVFDVDWRQGYPVGLIPLEHIEAKAMVRDLDSGSSPE